MVGVGGSNTKGVEGRRPEEKKEERKRLSMALDRADQQKKNKTTCVFYFFLAWAAQWWQVGALGTSGRPAAYYPILLIFFLEMFQKT